ncbi:MAG: FAD-binding oxidoreductase [Balneolaceae bacterium]
MSHKVIIHEIEQVTHDVRQYTFDKPQGYEFEPGQATEVAIDKEGWRDKKRPFTFTSLNEDPYLQFTIKSYPEHNGVTEQIGKLNKGEAFLIDDPWGTIQYNGPGVFLAGGAGITPFIAIFRDLYKKGEIEGNRLIFSNKAEKDIILKEEFKKMLGNDFINVITDEPTDEHIFLDGFVDKDFLLSQINDFDQPFYVCGPPAFNNAMLTYLEELGANPDALVFEE